MRRHHLPRYAPDQGPPDYAAIGGSALLDFMLEGFKLVPFPYIGTLQELPVEGAYEGPVLFDIEWADDGTVAKAEPRYEESQLILEELFPKDRPLFLMCGAGGYVGMTRQLLIHLGWDPELVYNIGGAWVYTGYKAVPVVEYGEDGEDPPLLPLARRHRHHRLRPVPATRLAPGPLSDARQKGSPHP